MRSLVSGSVPASSVSGRGFCSTVLIGVLCVCGASPLPAQPAAKTTNVPPLIKFSGSLTRGSDSGLSAVAGVTFAIYAEERGGAPLWTEIQNVQADLDGHYTVTLGSTRNEGLPAGLFASGQTRWLSVQQVGETEQPRSLMVSVPYALKAVDAETVGGLPASAFALASEPVNSKAAPFAVPPVGGGGTVDFVPLWTDGSGDLGNSVLFQSGTGSTAKIGINTTTPGAALDVKGAAIVRGLVSATSYQIGSNPFAFGNITNGNAFVGFSGSTVTTGTYNTANGVGALQRESGMYNTADGYQALGENYTGSGNTATGAQSLFNFTAASFNTADGFKALYGDNTSDSTGTSNAAVGSFALSGNTSGSYNTAVGASALTANDIGSYNTAVGYLSGYTSNFDYQTAGSYNTFVGYEAGVGIPGGEAIYNATAIGAYAVVSVNDALILGGTGLNSVAVGIGTSSPYSDYALDVEATPGGVINGGIVSDSTGGNIFVGLTNGAHQFRVDTNGVTYANGGFQSSGADFAESFAVRGTRSLYEPGDVLEIDPQARRHLTLANHPYATLVAGIYSTKPGLLASPRHIDDPAVKSSEVPLAVVGVVPCKVTAENGAIAPGDLLVTSSRAGYAMKGTDRRRMLGSVVGKALEPLPKGTGVVQVLVTLQ